MKKAAEFEQSSDPALLATSVDAAPSPGGAQFVTTHWSVVLAAGAGDIQAAGALNALCSAYWFPVYASIRRRGYRPDDAQDLAQSFFADLLSRAAFKRVDPQRGRFRSFLLGCLNNFLGHEWEKANAQKRGGKFQFVYVDWQAAETKYGLQAPAPAESIERSFDREWAVGLLDRTLARLQQEYVRTGRGGVYEVLKVGLGTEVGISYADLALRVDSNEGAVKVAVHRLRRRFRELLREEVAQTVATPAEIDEEMRYLSSVLESG